MTAAGTPASAPPLRLGTRASLLATTQSGHVADALRAATGREVELVPITTAGDVLTGPLAQLGGTGVFVAALREALLRGECDLVVHSMKDLPTADVAGLRIGAVPPRAPVRDALCTRQRAGAGVSLADLPEGAVVGSGSPRRVAQLLRRRPDLQVRGIRGNVDTRLRKVDEGEYDAIVLAEAGLVRIGRADRIAEVFDATAWPTSAGQGALAVEVRDDDASAALVAAITDPDAETTALAERAVLRRLEAGCAAPVGISARLTDASQPVVAVIAEVYALDGSRTVRVERRIPRPDLADAAGRDRFAALVVDDLMAAGAGDLADLGSRGPGGAGGGAGPLSTGDRP
ncbi:hydroxymethylbilane synthase [Microbacterium aurum]|uniref:Porphobilinogen deaminase n=1 Tax=Microbacterium aurum TaxID=36805 RepID=A0A1P8U7A0_9MICO|nr:hydroxymethylbilane synthase [Microbacterium aurum]APZ33989.1 hydroxymethylbilane synthase [Microbacterium aurum]MBM7827759.1 hydroxymethylbilane synthase [Microbacterium aurum]